MGEKEPAPHGKHVTAPPTPDVGTVPDVQIAQLLTEVDPRGDVWPAPHALQDAEPNALAYEPCKHCTHVAIEVAPVAALAVPLRQGTHAVCPAFAYEPGPHGVHVDATLDWPGGGFTNPLGHARHAASDAAA